jgi:hypothetical protein
MNFHIKHLGNILSRACMKKEALKAIKKPANEVVELRKNVAESRGHHSY